MTATTTVIIPNYNGMKFLEPCLKALQAQTYQNFKILVVDNGSTDGSAQWLEERGIDTIFLKENTGFFRGCEHRNPGGRYALCDPFEQ